MMKKLVILGIVATMVMGLAVAASAAYDASWVINMTASSDAAGTAGAYTSKAYTAATYTPGAGAEDGTLPPGTTGVAYLSSKIAGTDGYIKDGRPSFAGTDLVWDFTLTSVGAYPGGTLAYVSIWNPTDTAIVKTNAFVPLGGETIKLYKVDAGVKTLVWTAGAPSGTPASLGQFTVGQQFQLVESLEQGPVVPEPSSIIAMFSGLVGLAGFGIRRRK